MRLKLLLISALFILLIPTLAQATIHYASATGSASWASSISQSTPCSATTAMSNALAGDTVYFRGGIYALGQSDNNIKGVGVLTPSHSGTSDTNRIVFEAYPGETPHLRTTVSGSIISRAWGDTGHDYTTLRGFTISGIGAVNGNFGSVGIGNGSIGTVIDRCIFVGDPAGGTNTDNISGIAFGEDSNYTVISNCTFTDYWDTSNNHNTSAIKTYFAQYLTVTNCNFIHSTVAIYNKQASNFNNYSNNYIYNSNTAILVNVDNVGNSSNGTVANNIIIDSSYSALTLERQSTNYTPNWAINNNTIYNHSTTARMISINNSTGRYVYNNILGGNVNEGTVRYIADSTIDADDHNLYYNTVFSVYRNTTNYSSLSAWQASGVLTGGGNPGVGSLRTVTQNIWQNSSGTLSQINDFILVSGSPALNTGRTGNIGANPTTVGVTNLTNFSVITNLGGIGSNGEKGVLSLKSNIIKTNLSLGSSGNYTPLSSLILVSKIIIKKINILIQ